MKKALGRWQELKIFDYTMLLNLSGEYSVRELRVRENDWIAWKNLARCRLNQLWDLWDRPWPVVICMFHHGILRGCMYCIEAFFKIRFLHH